jgi:hypothetical protein
LDTNITVPLKGICLLERGSENRITPASAEELLPLLEKQAYEPLTEENTAVSHDLLQSLSESVPLWRMTCTKDADAARIAAAAMHEDK